MTTNVSLKNEDVESFKEAMQKMNISTIKNIGIIILRAEIVQTLHHRFFLKEVNSEKILHGTMTKMEQQEVG